MKKDPIIDELHRIRREHARKFSFDVDRIVADLRQRQQTEGHTVVRFPPKRPIPKDKAA